MIMKRRRHFSKTNTAAVASALALPNQMYAPQYDSWSDSVFVRGAEVRRSRPGLMTSHPAVARQQQYQPELSAAAK